MRMTGYIAPRPDRLDRIGFKSLTGPEVNSRSPRFLFLPKCFMFFVVFAASLGGHLQTSTVVAAHLWPNRDDLPAVAVSMELRKLLVSSLSIKSVSAMQECFRRSGV